MRETAGMNGDRGSGITLGNRHELGCGYWESFYGEEPCGAEATHVVFYLDDPALVCAEHGKKSLDDIEASLWPIQHVFIVRREPEQVMRVGDFVRTDGTWRVLAHRKSDGRWECWSELLD